jgi:2-phospho-L-lactate guanylyltransferase (CobY/MobA/RfbA family)
MLRKALAGLASARWDCWIAVTPDRFAARGRFWPPRWQAIPQGGGDLGARMARLFATLPPGPAVIVGSDIPELRATDATLAFAALVDHDLVVGPARDGGYWLVGLSRTARATGAATGLFRAVRWSTSHALADTLRNVPIDWRLVRLRELSDVDTAADLARIDRRSPRRAWRPGPRSAAAGSRRSCRAGSGSRAAT